jgi:polysaccharide deacetylase family protein (PEP-CTERM system associated)
VSAAANPVSAVPPQKVMNILSIDLEDWNQLAYRRFTGELPPLTSHNLERQMQALLSLLEETGTRATFFVLGRTAEVNPAIVKRVAAAGHEIASHGYGHRLVHTLTRAEFEDDTRRSKQILEDLSGAGVNGYRAAEFSIDRGSLWALEALAELGFAYDSSIFPVRQRRYGIAGFHPYPAVYGLANGLRIAEIPLATVDWAGLTWPVAGGGYFRLLPRSILSSALSRLARQHRTAVTYLHPSEFDPERLQIFETIRPSDPRVYGRGALFGFHQNAGRKSIPGKVRSLLSGFRFSTCAEFLAGADLSERRDLLSAAR